MKCSLLTLCFLTTIISSGQPIAPFYDKNFPSDQFIVKKEQRILGSISIKIIHVKPKKHDDPRQFMCRTWLTIRNGNKLIKELAQDVETSGSCSGLFFSESQLHKDLIMILKFGDDHGRFYLINNKGELKEYSGETFFISSDKKYLFSNYYSDLSGVTIVDLAKNELVYTGESKQYLADWYFQDDQYFTMKSESQKANGETGLLIFDFNTKSIKEKWTKERIDPKNKLAIYNDNHRPQDCNCGK